MIFWSILHWISDGFWSHFWCFFDTFNISTCNLLNHQEPLFFKRISMILLFRETWFLMIFLIFSVTSFSMYFFQQKDTNMDPKSDQNGTTNLKTKLIFEIFGHSGRNCFFKVFGDKKNRPKKRKKTEKNGKGANHHRKMMSLKTLGLNGTRITVVSWKTGSRQGRSPY